MSNTTTAPAGVVSSTELGLLTIGPHDHPEPHTMMWSALELAAIKEYAARCVAAERERWQEVVFDGWRVLHGLDEHARKRTSHQNVSDTLDALVRVMKPNTEAQRAAEGGPTGAQSSTDWRP